MKALLLLLLASTALGQTLPSDLSNVDAQENFENLSQEVRKTRLNLPKTNTANTWTQPQTFASSVTFAFPIQQSVSLVSTHTIIFVSTVAGLNNSGVYVSSPTSFALNIAVASNVNVTGGVFMSYGVPGVVRACSASQALFGATVSSGIITGATCSAVNPTYTYYSSVTFQAAVGMVLQPTDQYALTVTSGTNPDMLSVNKYGVVRATFTPVIKAYRSSALTVSNSTNQRLTYDNRPIDSGNWGFVVSAATVPTGGDGYYSVTCVVQFAANSTGRRVLQVFKNGAGVPGGEDERAPLSGSNLSYVRSNSTVHAVAGDYFECNAFQTSGGGLSTSNAVMDIVRLW